MGDVLVTSDLTVVRLPDLAWIADQHPLSALADNVIATVAATTPHSTKLYYNSSWAAGTQWRVYYCAWPLPATPRVAYTGSTPTPASTWTHADLTIPATEMWEDATYGIGSLCIVRTPGMAGAAIKAYYQYRDATTGHYETGRMDTADGLTFTSKQQVTFDAPLSGYDMRGITSAIWDEVNQKIIAAAHVSASGERIYGAILESTDGLAFTTTSLMIDPGLDHHSAVAGDMFDLHWIGKVGSLYTIMWTTSRDFTGSIQAGIGVSTDLENWYIPPTLVWTTASFRYPAFVHVAGNYYAIGVNASTSGFAVVKIAT